MTLPTQLTEMLAKVEKGTVRVNYNVTLWWRVPRTKYSWWRAEDVTLDELAALRKQFPDVWKDE